jgi:hypothetical protein
LHFVTFLLALKSNQKSQLKNISFEHGPAPQGAKYFAVRAFLGCQPHPSGSVGLCREWVFCVFMSGRVNFRWFQPTEERGLLVRCSFRNACFGYFKPEISLFRFVKTRIRATGMGFYFFYGWGVFSVGLNRWKRLLYWQNVISKL